MLYTYSDTFQENNEIFSQGHGEKTLLKINMYLRLHMFANYQSNIAKNTSESCENIALDIVLEVIQYEVL